MTVLKESLLGEVRDIFQSEWEVRDGRDVPDAETVGLGNKGIRLDATVLYADLADSTELVDEHDACFAAEIYKAYLRCATRIIKDEGGSITAYDGDRVMGVFVGSAKNTNAVRAGLRIRTAVVEVLWPLQLQCYAAPYVAQSKVGIDSSELLVAKTGVRGDNDLVWVGRAANHAAKMAALPTTYGTYISVDVFAGMNESLYTDINGGPSWTELSWEAFDGRRIYGTNHMWTEL